jgi:sterol 3beta-glucosyltransferase
MVKNKGFLPSGPSEISVQRKQIKSIVYSLLDACINPDKDSGVPFRPQAIIANPPAYGTISLHPPFFFSHVIRISSYMHLF